LQRNQKTAIISNAAFLATVIVTTVIGYVIAPYLVIAWIIYICVMVNTNNIKENEYAIYLFGISLAMLYQVSLLGSHVIGADINSELMFSRMAMNEGLDWNYPHQYVSSIVVTVVVPVVSRVLHTSPVWIYKAVLPIAMAAVTPIMYLAWKNEVTAKKAFWAGIFFCIVPVVTLEIVGIGKTMAAEMFMAIAILVLVRKDSSWKFKAIILIILTALCMICHYAVGLTVICMMLVCIGMLCIGKLTKWSILLGNKVTMIALSVTMVASGAIGYVYFSNTSDGMIMEVVGRIVRLSSTVRHTAITMQELDTLKELSEEERLYYYEHGYKAFLETADQQHYLVLQPDMVLAGVGLDIMQTKGWQTAFRIIQYITELLIILGVIRILRKKTTFSPIYIAGVASGLVVLMCCIFVPKFSRILNMTRFYQLSLFWLAPVMIVGIDSIKENSKWIPCGVLLVYFAFTSGLVFEFAGYDRVNTLNPPPSIALSNDRISLYGIHNADDLACAEWLAYESDKDIPIVSDLHSKRLLQSYFYEYPRLRKFHIDGYVQPRWTAWNLPEGNYYVFLSTWNVESEQFMTHENEKQVLDKSPGVRYPQPIPNWLFGNAVVYRNGNSVVTLHKEGE